MRFVFDASSLLEIRIQCRDFLRVLNELTDLIEDQEATFCDPVRDEIARKAKDEEVHVWMKAVEKRRSPSALNPDWARVRWVQERVPDLIDEESPYEQAGPFVLAQTLELQAEYAEDELFVVTEETYEKPTRRGLASACAELGLPFMTLLECLDECDIDPN